MKSSKNSITILILSLAIALLLLPGLLKGGKPQEAKVQGGTQNCSDAPVTSTLQITGQVTQSSNYRIEGDGLGSYNNGVNSVSSIIQAANCTGGVSGDWILDATTSTTRTILIDLRQPVPGSGAQQIFSYEYLPARIIVKCGYYAIAGGFPAMKLNQTLSCPSEVRILFGGSTYRLAMTSGANAQPDYPETNNVQVACTAVSSATNQCVAWTVFPITQAGGTVENVARLQQIQKNGWANLGDFYVTFLFYVTNP
jgi:hypothetical protein